MRKTYAEVDPKTLVPADDNPQKMSVAMFTALKAAIAADNGTVDDPVVWKDHKLGKMRIISGHHRIKACSELGQKVSVKIIDDSTADEVWYRKRVLSVNKTHGQPDDEVIRKFLEKTFAIEGVDVNAFFEDTGYNAKEIQAYLAHDDLDLARQKLSDEDKAAAANEMTSANTVVRMVQLFFTNESHPVFMADVQAWMKITGAQSITDAVASAVKDAVVNGMRKQA